MPYSFSRIAGRWGAWRGASASAERCPPHFALSGLGRVACPCHTPPLVLSCSRHSAPGPLVLLSGSAGRANASVPVQAGVRCHFAQLFVECTELLQAACVPAAGPRPGEREAVLRLAGLSADPARDATPRPGLALLTAAMPPPTAGRRRAPGTKAQHHPRAGIVGDEIDERDRIRILGDPRNRGRAVGDPQRRLCPPENWVIAPSTR